MDLINLRGGKERHWYGEGCDLQHTYPLTQCRRRGTLEWGGLFGDVIKKWIRYETRPFDPMNDSQQMRTTTPCHSLVMEGQVRFITI
jgi:hypothetical protein